MTPLHIGLATAISIIALMAYMIAKVIILPPLDEPLDDPDMWGDR